MNQSEICYFGMTNFRNAQRRFGILTDDRRRHMYFIGKTGTGKTTVLENMMIQDVQNGHGLAVIDPHGDFVEKVLKFIPSHRINDVLYVNPADVDYPVAFNPLEAVNAADRNLVASGLLSVFKKMWAESWGPRLEYILRNCILSLLEYEGSTLLGILRILVDDEYREKVVAKITDPVVKAFWITEFGQYEQKFKTEAISPIQNKIGQFLSSSLIRNIIGQPKSTFNLRTVMDERKILLLNLAKGRIGEDNAGLLGGMMITKLQMAAMSRVDIPEKDRKDFFLYVDEFQNFATESFANILSEARKYRLNLVIAHQYIEQLDETVAAAVFGNVGSLITFRVGAADAEFLAKEFVPVFDETDLVNLAKYDIYLRLMIGGIASDPFSATTLPPISGATGNGDKVIQASRERYATKREVVEEKISRWHDIEKMYAGMAKGPTGGRARRPQQGGGGYGGGGGGYGGGGGGYGGGGGGYNGPRRDGGGGYGAPPRRDSGGGGGNYGPPRRDDRQGGPQQRDERWTLPPQREPAPAVKPADLEPVLKDTGEKGISLNEALKPRQPNQGNRPQERRRDDRPQRRDDRGPRPQQPQQRRDEPPRQSPPPQGS